MRARVRVSVRVCVLTCIIDADATDSPGTAVAIVPYDDDAHTATAGYVQDSAAIQAAIDAIEYKPRTLYI